MLEVGDNWRFHQTGVDNGSDVDRLWSRRVVELLPDGMFRVSPPDATGTSVFDASWNPRYPQRPEFYPLVFKFPLRLGAAWSFASPPADYFQRGNFKAVAYESITVPAGTFDCFRLEGISTFNSGVAYAETRRITQWYCPVVRYVAKIHVAIDVWRSYGPGLHSVLDSELVSFSVSGASSAVDQPEELESLLPLLMSGTGTSPGAQASTVAWSIEIDAQTAEGAIKGRMTWNDGTCRFGDVPFTGAYHGGLLELAVSETSSACRSLTIKMTLKDRADSAFEGTAQIAGSSQPTNVTLMQQ